MGIDISGGTVLLGAYVVSILCIIAGVYYTFAVAPFKEAKSGPHLRGARAPDLGDADDSMGDNFVAGGGNGGEVDMRMIDAALAGADGDADGGDLIDMDGEDIQVPQRMRAMRMLSKKDLHKAEKKKLKSDKKAYLDSEREQREERRLAKEKKEKERELLSEARYLQQRLERRARGEDVSSTSSNDSDGSGASDNDGGSDVDSSTRKAKKRAHPEKAFAKSASVNSAELRALEMRSYVLTEKTVSIAAMAAHFGATEAECVRIISEALRQGGILGVFDVCKQHFYVLSEDKLLRLVESLNANGRTAAGALDAVIRDICTSGSSASSGINSSVVS